MTNVFVSGRLLFVALLGNNSAPSMDRLRYLKEKYFDEYQAEQFCRSMYAGGMVHNFVYYVQFLD